jgi:hypothetical protein
MKKTRSKALFRARRVHLCGFERVGIEGWTMEGERW